MTFLNTSSIGYVLNKYVPDSGPFFQITKATKIMHVLEIVAESLLRSQFSGSWVTQISHRSFFLGRLVNVLSSQNSFD